MGVVLVVSCDTQQWLIVVQVGKFWLILWVLWFVVMFGNVMVVVRWVWYRVFGWFSVVCHVNGDDLGVLLSLWIVGDVGGQQWGIVVGQNREMGEKREKQIFFNII